MKLLTNTFKNSGNEVNNDVIYPELFDFSIYKYFFSIRPKSKFWRFGLRISKTENVEFYQPEHRYKDPQFKQFKDLYLGVGEWDGTTWSLPDRVHLAQYNIKDPSDHILNYSVGYREFSEVKCEVHYDENGNGLTVSYAVEGCDPFSTNLESLIIPY